MAIAPYLLRRVQDLAHPGRPILDLGCGDGRLVVELDSLFPGEVYGFDLPSTEKKWQSRLADSPAGRLISSGQIRFGPSEEGLPFDSGLFGLVVSNQVVEHVEDLDSFFGEAARVLAPDGTGLIVFPPNSHIIEAHCRVPFAHWLPPGRARRRLIGLSHRLLGVPRQQSNEDVARYWDGWITRNTHYRSPGDVVRSARRHFGSVGNDAEAYLSSITRGRVSSSPLALAPYYLLNTTLRLSEPRVR